VQFQVLELLLAVDAHLEQLVLDELAVAPFVGARAVEENDGPFRRLGAERRALTMHFRQNKAVTLGRRSDEYRLSRPEPMTFWSWYNLTAPGAGNLNLATFCLSGCLDLGLAVPARARQT